MATKEELEKLNQPAQTLQNTTENTQKTEAPTYSYPQYQQSDLVKNAQNLLQQQMASKPGRYTSPWQTQLNDTINKILNREPFSYDLNGDALYQQYKDQYVNGGRQAMMDTMGQAAALTGGYGNSYAQGAGQQAYNGYLQQLNNKIPELYQLALNKYQMEGNELTNRFGILNAQDQQDYGRYRDTVSDWNLETDRLQNQFNQEREFDINNWRDNRDFGFNQFMDNRNFNYQNERDQVADSQWQAEFNEAVRQFNFANKLGEFAPVAAPSSGGGGGGSGYYVYNPKPKPDEKKDEEENPSTEPDNTQTDTGKTADVHTVAGQKALTSQINKEINAALKAGSITAAQAAALKQMNRNTK